MQIVPLQQVPSQSLSVQLGGQDVNLTLRQLSTGLYMNVAVGTREIVGLVLCEDTNRIVRDLYLGFLGDLVFVDQSGEGFEPYYDELGTRFVLYYIEADELPVGVG